MTDPATAAWTRNPADERAAAAGCRFDAERGAYTVWWVERYCRLYEGEQAGEPLLLRGCHECGTYGLPASHEFPEWDDAARAAGLERAARYAACVAAGHALDWQYECTMRLFGWIRYSERWKRFIRRFTQGIIFIGKKNKKTPTIAAIGLYLTCGDGEMGQHVFFGAKDGKQARIACSHAKAMVEQSPELDPNRPGGCMRINENTMCLSHPSTRSNLEPLSSGNKRHQQGKEGLNGSVMIDEIHVVDREFIARLTRMGISRSEPLQLEVSTAGSDPESYGMDRFDLAERVMRGDYPGDELQHVFAAVYAAPQKLTDAELAADPLRYAAMANPAMGHTVDAEEWLRDYHASKNTLSELAWFKMHRLNIWQASDTPWLDMLAWGECRREYGEDDLAGEPCVAALDLAKTRHTCALTLLFWLPQQEVYRQLAYFWVPRERALALRDKVPYLQWARDGRVKITEGNIADYNVIRQDILRLGRTFRFEVFTYDDWYAEQLVQRLIEEDRALDLDQVSNFTQSISSYAGPTDEYEAAVLSRVLHHDGNPMLTWQAGNALVRTDPNLNKRPVRRKHDDVRTVDGITAGVMTFGHVERLKQAGAGYEPGSLRD
jgi:phage terminase large subunit-like protein